jgi:hypothetical protein
MLADVAVGTNSVLGILILVAVILLIVWLVRHF